MTRSREKDAAARIAADPRFQDGTREYKRADRARAAQDLAALAPDRREAALDALAKTHRPRHVPLDDEQHSPESTAWDSVRGGQRYPDPPPGKARLATGALIPIPPAHSYFAQRMKADPAQTNAALALRKLLDDTLQTPARRAGWILEAYEICFGEKPAATPPWIGVLLDEVERVRWDLEEERQRIGLGHSRDEYSFSVRACDLLVVEDAQDILIRRVRDISPRDIRVKPAALEAIRLPAGGAPVLGELRLLDGRGRPISQAAIDAFKAKHAGALFVNAFERVSVHLRQAARAHEAEREKGSTRRLERGAPAFVEVADVTDEMEGPIRTAEVLKPRAILAVDSRNSVAGYRLTLNSEQRRSWLDLDPEGVLRLTRRVLPRGVEHPAWARSPELVAWLISKLAAGRGGGPSGRLSRKQLAQLLADPKKLAQARAHTEAKRARDRARRAADEGDDTELEG